MFTAIETQHAVHPSNKRLQPVAAHAGAEVVRPIQLLLLAFQFGLFLVVLYLYDLESRAFLHLGIVAFIGFLIHYFLPFRFRLPFFAALSVFSLAAVFGFQLEHWSLTGLIQAAWIIGLGLGIVGICHLPTSFANRVLLVVASGIVLCVLRTGMLPVPWSAAIWPILGSMFMFRTAVYLHALRFDKEPPSLVEAICYFFMLPNPCFPLFPVVDFQAFRRTYYDSPDRHQIYQTGVTWLFRGTTHLLLYRLVYHYLVIDASSVSTVPQLAQYLVWPFLLYLRVSGQFHIIVGMLRLFGFGLPETHRLYFLSSSFTDFWRRINIYWKDFMMKMIYYPAYFRIRRLGESASLVVTTVLVFFCTWILHAYQWFWIRGTWLFTWNDGLFWAILAVLVVVNALYEAKHGRRRTLGGAIFSWRAMLTRSLKTVAVFSVICTLWSFWSASSIEEWLSAFQVLSTSQARVFASIAPILLCLALFIGLPAAMLMLQRPQKQFHFSRSSALTIAGLLAMIGLHTNVIGQALSPEIRGIVTNLGKSDLNRRDFAAMERGYYENLLDVNRFNPELLEVYRTRPKDWSIGLGDDAYIHTDKPPYFQLRPAFEGRDRGAIVRTNSWGMRDDEYTKVKPEGVTRIAMVGSSFVQGVGVEADKTFEALFETALNASNSASSPGRCEVLNFGVAGYTQVQHLGVVQNMVFDFDPDLVFYIEHGNPFDPTMKGTVNYVRSGRYVDYNFLQQIVAKAGAVKGMDPVEIRQRLLPYQNEILSGMYRYMVDCCSSHGVVAVWIYLPRPEEFDEGPSELELRIAREAGFQVVVLDDVYQETPSRSLWLARWDHHPNTLGHKMIAERLFDAVHNAGVIPLGKTIRHD